jgi:Phage integrase family
MGRFVSATGQFLMATYGHSSCPPTGSFSCPLTLGYEHLKRHGLRHTGLTWMADAGVPLHSLRKIAGHGTLTTTRRYLNPWELHQTGENLQVAC